MVKYWVNQRTVYTTQFIKLLILNPLDLESGNDLIMQAN